MRKRYLGWIVLTVVFAVCTTYEAKSENAAQQDALFSLFPENTVAAVRLASIEQGSKDLNAFTLVAAGLPLGSELEKLILDAVDLKSLDGIDPAKPLWLIVGLDETMDVSLSMLVPIADRDKVIAASELQKNESGVINTGKRSLLFGEGTALFCEGELKDNLKTWYSSTPLEKLASVSCDAKDDLAVWIRLTSVSKTLRELSGTFLESMQSLMALSPVASPNTMPMLQKETGWILDLMDQTEMVRLGLQLSSEALVLQKQSILKEGSPMMDYFRTAQLADVSDVLSVIDPNNLISVVFNFDPKFYELIRDRMINDFSDMKINIESMKKLWDDCAKMNKGPIGVAINASAKSDQPVAFTELIALKDITDASGFLANMSTVVQDSANMVAPASGVQIKIKEENNIGTYKSIPYSKLSIRYKVDDPESPMAEIFAKQNLDYFYALTDKALIFTTESMPDVLDRAMDSKPVSLPTFINKNSLAAMRINLLQGLKFAKQFMAQNAGGINPLQMVEIPADSNNPGITIEVHVENGNPVSSMTIPVQEITAVRDAVMGAMMQQQGGDANQGEEEETEEQ